MAAHHSYSASDLAPLSLGVQGTPVLLTLGLFLRGMLAHFLQRPLGFRYAHHLCSRGINAMKTRPGIRDRSFKPLQPNRKTFKF